MPDEDNGTYTCVSCDEPITSPGIGHSESCSQRGKDLELVRYTPPPFVRSIDGKYYANLQGGWETSRRVGR